MRNFKKFSADTKRTGLGEGSVYLLRKFQAMFDDLSRILQLRTKHFIRFSGIVTTPGGSTTVEISAPGVKASMRCDVSVRILGATRTHVIAHRCEENKIIVELQADPGDDHVLEYTVSV